MYIGIFISWVTPLLGFRERRVLWRVQVNDQPRAATTARRVPYFSDSFLNRPRGGRMVYQNQSAANEDRAKFAARWERSICRAGIPNALESSLIFGNSKP